MRTTLTLEDGLVAKLRASARKRNLSLKQVINEALRNGLQATAAPKKTKPFRIKSFSMGVMPGVDYDKINQFLDDEEIEHVIAKMKQGR
ncbi:MAG TPA: hypothetical protein VGW39_04070 [Chthoniobacterales bacterium]|nr:hypothetical protein [Chthoniobacterales bacterium]